MADAKRLSLSLHDLREHFHKRVGEDCLNRSGSKTSSERVRVDIEVLQKIRSKTLIEAITQEKARNTCQKYHIIISALLVTYTIFLAAALYILEMYFSEYNGILHAVGLIILAGLQGISITAGWEKIAELHRIAAHNLHHIIDLIDIALAFEYDIDSTTKDLTPMLHEIQCIKNSILIFTPPPVFIDTIVNEIY